MLKSLPHSRKRALLLITCLLSTFLSWSKTSSLPEYIPTTGTDFWLTYMNNYETNNAFVKLHLYIVADTTTYVAVKDADGGSLYNGVITAGTCHHLEIDRSKAYLFQSDRVERKGIHVTSTRHIALYMSNIYDNSAALSYDASPVLSTSSLGTEYMAQTYYVDGSASELAIVATEANTNVTIVPNHLAESAMGTYPAGTAIPTISFTREGDAYLLKAATDGYGLNDLSGSTILADKPVAVFCGGVMATVPYDNGAGADHLVEQIAPISSWGKRFVLPEFHGFPDRASSSEPTYYSVTAIYDNTLVSVSDGTSFMLNRGETSSDYVDKTVAVEYDEAPKMLEASKPVMVMAYMTNGTANKTYNVSSLKRRNVGEPSMIYIPSVRQSVHSASFVTFEGSNVAGADVEPIQYVAVVVPDSAKGDMKLNGVTVPASKFVTLSSTFAGQSVQYAYARLEALTGFNKLENAKAPFLSYAYGVKLKSAESYGMATVYNTAPASPKVLIDGVPVLHEDTTHFCNTRPGVAFKAEVDYEHDSVRWNFGDNVVSRDMETTHVYEFYAGSGEDTKTVLFTVYHHDPLSGTMHVDSVRCSLIVHPTYYDTLRTTICGRQGSYVWTGSSQGVPFTQKSVIENNPKQDATGKVTYSGFTKNTSTFIADRVVYHTVGADCDSIFALELTVLPEIVHPTTSAAVCQGELFEWANHTNAAVNHLYKDGVSITAIPTDIAGTFTIVDSMIASCGCDSIESLTLTVYPKPAIHISSLDSVCETTTASTIVSYTATEAATYTYHVLNASDAEVASGSAAAATNGSFAIATATYLPGEYRVVLTANSDKGCVSLNDTAVFLVYPRPILVLNNLDAVCRLDETCVEVTYSSTNADTYSYQLTQGSTIHKYADNQPIGTSYTIDIAGLAAGTYTLTMRVVSEQGCVSEEKSKSLIINEKPTISAGAIANICREDAVVTMPYATDYATAFDYYVWSGTTLIVSATNETASASGNVVLAADTWDAGDYVVKMVSHSATCTSDTSVATFTIYEKPNVSLTDISDVCYGTANIEADYVSAYAATYTWDLLDASNSVKLTNTSPAEASGSISMNISTLTPGAYHLEMTATSANGCESDKLIKTFAVIPLPTVAIENIDDICAGENAEVSYSSTGADTYDYTLYQGVTALSITAVDQSAASDGTFTLPTSTLPTGTYTLKMTTKSGVSGCESTEAQLSFMIHPIPTIVIDDLAPICQTTDASVDVSYHAENATTYTYVVTDASSNVLTSVSAPVSSYAKFTLETDTLEAGVYTIMVKAVSNMGCESAPVTTTLTVYPRPTLSLNPISAICYNEETSITVTYSSTNAATYDYQLLQGTTVRKTASNQTIGTSYTVDVAGLAAGEYTIKMTVTSEHGCVSEEKATQLTIHPQPTLNMSNLGDICQGDDVVPVSYTSAEASTYEYVVLNATNAEMADVSNQAALASGTYNISTNAYPAGDYVVRMVAKSANGCVSDTSIKTFTIHPTYEFVENDIICNTGNKQWRGLNLTGLVARPEAYVYHDSLLTIHGCDSVYTLNLIVNPTEPIVTKDTICFGETYDWTIAHPCTGLPYTIMHNLNSSCVMYDTLYCPSTPDCSNVYKLDLHVRPMPSYIDESLVLCGDNVQAWRGLMIAEPGIYTTTDGVDEYGCVRLYRLTATMLAPVTQATSASICYGETFTIGDTRYEGLAAGTHELRDTLLSQNGCDSIYMVVNLTVGMPYKEETSIVACESYTWRGHIYTTSGDYVDSYTTVNCCDSSYVLHLTICPSYHFYETYDVTNKQLPYTVHEYTFTAACSDYERAYTTVAGCDSIYHITINVHPDPIVTDTTRATICEGTAYAWYGADYAATGMYSHMSNDTVHVLCLMAYPVYHDTITMHTCGEPVYGHTTTGLYPLYTGTSIHGCDSIVVLNLIAHTPSSTDLGIQNACTSSLFTWGHYAFIPQLGADVVLKDTLQNVAGCDSVIALTVHPVAPTYAPLEYATICQGDVYSWHGMQLSAPGTYNDTVAGTGCGTIYQLALTVNPTYTIESDIEVREGTSFIWRDTTLRTDGDYYRHYTTELGCDSTYHIHFHTVQEYFVSRDTLVATACESYAWRGQTYTSSGLYSDTVWAGGRYDAIRFLDLTIERARYVYEREIVSCDNELIYWHCNYYNPAEGVYEMYDTVPSLAGCDSITHTTFRVYSSTTTNETATICQGDVLLWHGQILTEAGVYADTLSSMVTGCDSIFALTLSVTPRRASDTVSHTICNLSSYDWEGYHVENLPAGDYAYYKYYTPAGECETFHMLNLHVYDITPDTTHATICYGETYDWEVDTDGDGINDRLIQHGIIGQGAHQLQYDTITDGDCKHVFVLDLTILPAPISADTVGIMCKGGIFTWRGHSFSQPGDYTDTIIASTGCDSIYTTLHLAEPTPIYISAAPHLCYGETYTWPCNGQTYTASAKDTFAVASVVTGCDSLIYTLDLTINGAELSGEESVIICADEYVWHGITYTASGNYTQVLTTAMGCDSTATLHLTIGHPQTFYETAIVKPSQLPYTWHENTYTAAGTYYQNHLNQYGCDSNYVLTLMVNPRVEKRDTVAICQGETHTCFSWTWQPTHDTIVTYTTSDTIFSRMIVVGQKFDYHDTIRVCEGESFTWRGGNYVATTNQTLSWNGSTILGCDSNYTCHVFVAATDATTAAVTLCEGEVFNWGPYSELLPAGVYNRTATFTSVLYGCDSTVNMTLTVVGPTLINPEESIAICESQLPYAWRGHSLTQAGWYGDTIRSVVSGCDSVLSSVQLVVNHDFYQYDDVEIREGATFVWTGHIDGNGHDRIFTTDGVYYDSHQTIDGCDSIYELHLHVGFYQRDTITETACEAYTRRGTTYTTSGLYTDTVVAANPQQIHYLDLTIHNKVVAPVETVVECASSYDWNGTTYTASGVYSQVLSGAAANGCDSVVTLHLTLNPVYSFVSNLTICEDELPYQWQDTLLRTTGTYVRRYSTMNGCDSIYTINLNVAEVVTLIERDTITASDTYTWYGLTISGLAPSPLPYPYYHYFQNTPNGCDSVAILYLQVSDIYTDSITICAGETYTWNGEVKASTGLYTKVLTSLVNGVDSVDRLFLTVLPPAYTKPLERHVICPGSAFIFNDHSYTEPGLFTDTARFFTANCDSVYTPLEIVLSDTTAVLEPLYQRFDTDPCYVWNNAETLCNPGIYTGAAFYKNNADGCSTRHIVPVQVFHRVDSTFFISGHCAGDSFTFDFFGRDTTITLGSTTQLIDTVDVADPTLVDTIRYLDIRLSTLYATDTTVYVLRGTPNWHWPGHTTMTLSTPGSPAELYANTSATGVLHYYDSPSCDTIYRLELHVIEKPTHVEHDTICQNTLPYIWALHNEIVGQSAPIGLNTLTGETMVSYGTAENFSRFDTLYLMINPTYSTTLPDTTLQQGAEFDFLGMSVNTSTPHTEQLSGVLTAANGCDSIVYQTICISPYEYTELRLCYGEAYPWLDKVINYAIDTIAIHPNPYGCDSVFRLKLTFESEPITNPTEYLFATHLPYMWRNQTCTQYGIFYYDTTYTVSGCAEEYFSCVLLNKPTYTTRLHACPGEAVVWEGQTYVTPATGMLTGRIEKDDRYLQLELTPYTTFYQSATATLYKGDAPYEWKNEQGSVMRTFSTNHKLQYSKDTVFTSVVTGCDSIYHLNLMIIGDTTIVRRDTLCQDAGVQQWPEANLAVSLDTLPALNTTYTWYAVDQVSVDSVVVYKWVLYYAAAYMHIDHDTIFEGDTINYHGMEYTNLGEGSHVLHFDTLTNAGCDSLFVDSVWVMPLHVEVVNVVIDTSICYGDYFDWYVNGHLVQPDGYYLTTPCTRVYRNYSVNGDTLYLYQLNLAVRYPTVVRTDTTILYGNTLNWFDLHGVAHTFTSTTTYRDTLHYAGGCDSIIQILNVRYGLQPIYTHLYDTVCMNDYYYRHGEVLKTDVAGDFRYQERAQAENGADSLIIFHLNVQKPKKKTETIIVSPFDSKTYTWRDYTYNAGMNTTFVDVVPQQTGCDSIYTLRVMTGLAGTDTVDVWICSQDRSFRWQRNDIDVTIVIDPDEGMYFVANQTPVQNVDSIHVLRVHRYHLYIEEVYDTICSPSGKLERDTIIELYKYEEKTNPNGVHCDSLVRYIYRYGAPSYNHVIYDTVPVGSSYKFGSTFIPYVERPTNYFEHILGPENLHSRFGCDSIVTVHLFVTPQHHFYDTVKICLGDSYYWSHTGETYTPDRAVYWDYSKTYTNQWGNDSVYHLTLNVSPTYSKVENVAIPYGTTMRWRSHDYGATGTYIERLYSVNGCDSTFTLNLTVGRLSLNSTDVAICQGESYQWIVNGDYLGDYSRQGIYYHKVTYVEPGGLPFDSVLVLNLTVNPVYNYVSEDVVAQDSAYVWVTDGQTYNTHVVGDQYLSWAGQTAAGCDSTYFLTLHVMPTYREYVYDTICVLAEQPHLHGFDSIHFHYYQTEAGFDSITEHHIFIHGIQYVDENDTTCRNGGKTWRDQDVSDGRLGYNVFSSQSQTSYGCDTIFELRMYLYPDTIFHSYDTIADSQTQGYQWRDTTIMTDLSVGDYIIYDSLVTMYGCDSVYAHHLSVRPTYKFEDIINVCDNEEATWEGMQYSARPAGVYYDTVRFKTTPSYAAQPLYDSIRVMILNVHPTYVTNLPDTIICPSERVQIGDTLVWEAGHHEIWLQSMWGCDSVCHINITHFNDYDTLYVDTICYSSIYYWEDSIYNYAQGGTYTDVRNYTTIHGCDSVLRLQLTIENLYQKPTYQDACLNDVFVWSRRRPMSFKDTVLIEHTIYTPDEPILMTLIDTVVTPLGCIYYDTLYVDVVEPVVLLTATAEDLCPEEGVDMQINYTIGEQGGNAREYSLFFSNEAKAQGFVDIEKGMVTSQQSILVPVNFTHARFPQADTYEATLYLSNGSCQDTSAMTHITFSFNVMYPSWFAEQHWNDMLGVLSSNATANLLKPEGYSFVSYQWYRNGQPIDEATSPVLYFLHTVMYPYGHDGENWSTTDEIQVLLTDSTGRSILTCPINPRIVGDNVQPQDYYFSVNPTFIDRNNPYTNILSNTTGTYMIYDAAGKLVAIGEVDGCEHTATMIEVPYVPGTYLIRMMSNDVSPLTGKITTATVKILVY